VHLSGLPTILTPAAQASIVSTVTDAKCNQRIMTAFDIG